MSHESGYILCSKPFTAEDHSKLINLVRCYPFMYDTADPLHHNRKLIEHTWSDIARQLNTTEKACKDKWTTLRSNFRRELRKIRATLENNPAAKPHSTWPYFHLLSFLRVYVKLKDPLSGQIVSSDNEEISVTPDVIHYEVITGTEGEEGDLLELIEEETVPQDDSASGSRDVVESGPPLATENSQNDGLTCRIPEEQFISNFSAYNNVIVTTTEIGSDNNYSRGRTYQSTENTNSSIPPMNIKSECLSPDEYDNQDPQENLLQNRRRAKRRASQDEETTQQKLLKEIRKFNEIDDNKFFLLSLVNKMRKLSPKDNMAFRIEVQEALNKRLFPNNNESYEWNLTDAEPSE